MKLTALLDAARKLKEPVIFSVYFVGGLITCLIVLNDQRILLRLGLSLAMTLIPLGAGANRAAMAANGGLMAVRGPQNWRFQDSGRHTYLSQETKLKKLCDIFPIKVRGQLRILSVGDMLIYAGRTGIAGLVLLYVTQWRH